MQAQDFAGARWSVGLRLPRSTDVAVEAAIERREFVRSWPMRGTLHFIAGEDLGWMLELTTPRLIKQSVRRRAQQGITDAELVTARDTAIATLSGNRILERNALLAEFDKAGVSVASQRGYHLLWYLSQTGVTVLGPASGKQQTFALLDEWVDKPRRLDRDESLGELALRYFTSHGPATEKDLARWASITLGDVRTGLAIAKDSLEQRDFDGVAHYLAPGLQPASNAVHALPGFDEYMLGYGDRSAALAPEHSSKILPGGNGVFRPTIVVNGEVLGTWRKLERSKSVAIGADWFETPTSKAQAGFERAVKRYGTFVGKEIVI